MYVYQYSALTYPIFRFCFFFNDTATTEIYTLSLHDALPIYTPIIFIEARINLSRFVVTGCAAKTSATVTNLLKLDRKSGSAGMPRPISYAVFCLKKKKRHQNLTNQHMVAG